MPASNIHTTTAAVTVYLSLSWVWLFAVLGGSQYGRDQLYFPLAEHFFGNEHYYKGGLVLIVLVIPILLAATVSSLLFAVAVANGEAEGTTMSTDASSRHQRNTKKSSSFLQRCYQRLVAVVVVVVESSFSSTAATAIVFVYIVFPCCAYVVISIARKLQTTPSDPEARYFYVLLMVANSFAFMSLLALSWLLIPVARQSSLLSFFATSISSISILRNNKDVTPIQALHYVHMTSGYLVIVGALVHSVLHMLRWHDRGEGWMDFLVPPSICWWSISMDRHQDHHRHHHHPQPQCHNPQTDCSCYNHWRNWTGFVASLAVLVQGVVSMWPWIRRRACAVFYMTHVIAGPLAVVMTVVHYPLAILSVAPSLLIYVASSFPNMMELHLQQQQRKQQKQGQRHCGVRIVSVQEISSSSSNHSSAHRGGGSRSIVSLQIVASPEAMRRFRPGQYVKLSCPEISFLHHPFTINNSKKKTMVAIDKKDTSNNNNNIMVIHFRVCGPFTTALARRLSPSSNMKLPCIYLNGYFGSMHRLQQVLEHDVSVFVAGGIGITPYLSLLQELVTTVDKSSKEEEDDDDNDDDIMIVDEDTADLLEKDHEQHQGRQVVVILHWICRDDRFIEYIQQEYFQPLLLTLWKKEECNDGSFLWSSSPSRAKSAGLVLRIVIHHTNGGGGGGPSSLVLLPPPHSETPLSSSSSLPRSYTDVEEPLDQKNIDVVERVEKNSSMVYAKEEEEEEDGGGGGGGVFASTTRHGGVPFTPTKFAVGTHHPSRLRDNIVPFVAFSLIAWLGLGIIWYHYTHVVIQPTEEEEEERVLNRIWSLVGVVVLGWIVSWFMNVMWASSPDVVQYDDNKKKKKRASRRRGDGEFSFKSDNDDNAENRHGHCDVEHNQLHTACRLIGDNTSNDNNKNSVNVASMKTLQGRPSVHDLLRVLDNNAHSPALFVCGPTSLMQEIRKAATQQQRRQQQHWRLQQKNRHGIAPNSIALYEEVFEM